MLTGGEESGKTFEHLFTRYAIKLRGGYLYIATSVYVHTDKGRKTCRAIIEDITQHIHSFFWTYQMGYCQRNTTYTFNKDLPLPWIDKLFSIWCCDQVTFNDTWLGRCFRPRNDTSPLQLHKHIAKELLMFLATICLTYRHTTLEAHSSSRPSLEIVQSSSGITTAADDMDQA